MCDSIRTSLALEVIAEHFGKDTGIFARHIVENVLPVSIREILSTGNFSRDFSISALGILFQHGLLTVHDGAKVEIHVLGAILRLLFPRFELVFEKQYGLLGAQVAKLFFTQGRMTEIAFRAQITSCFRQESEEWRRSLYETFREIVSADNSFIVSSSPFSQFDPDVEGDSQSIRVEKHSHRGIETSRNVSHTESVYAIDFMEIIRSIRNTEILSSLKRRFTDELTLQIFQTFLQKDRAECGLSISVLMKSFPKKQQPSVEHIVASLSSTVTGEYICHNLTKESHAEEYRLHTDKIVREHRVEYVLKSISNKFGVDGIRIFRLLMRYEAEEMTISDDCKISPENVRAILFEFQRMGFAHAHCVSGSPKDTFLWRLNMSQALDEILIGCLKSLRILFARLQHVAEEPEKLTNGSLSVSVDCKLAHAINETLLSFLWIDIF